METDPNCCYFAFEWAGLENSVYYTCINKKRLIKSVGKKNMTAAFIYDTSDEVFPILNNIVYVECADQKDVIVSPSKMKPPSLGVSQRRKKRRLTFKSFEEFVEENSDEVPQFKNILNKVLNFFLDFVGNTISFLSKVVKYLINW